MSRRMMGLLLCLLTLVVAPEARGATTRVVRKTGTDNPTCLQATPCRTIQHAVNIADPGDQIEIFAGKFAEYFGVTIAKNLSVVGAGIFSTLVYGAFDGFSIFRIEPGATVAIHNLDVMYGNAEEGGGILNQGDLTLDRVRIWRNRAQRGGGIFNSGALRISNSEIARNSASDSGGGIYNENYTELQAVRLVVNQAPPGKIGGIENRASGGFPLVETKWSEISHNGGHGIGSWGNMNLANTTVSRNGQAGIFIGDGHYTDLVHVTIAENGGGGLYRQASAAADHEITFRNTIVAKNTGAQCSVSGGVIGSISATGSLFGDGTCILGFPGNLIGVDPKLGPLKLNGGTTFTHALKPDSPAIDAASLAECLDDDQRGFPRPIDGDGDGDFQCDMGALEYSPLKRGWPTEGGP